MNTVISKSGKIEFDTGFTATHASVGIRDKSKSFTSFSVIKIPRRCVGGCDSEILTALNAIKDALEKLPNEAKSDLFRQHFVEPKSPTA